MQGAGPFKSFSKSLLACCSGVTSAAIGSKRGALTRDEKVYSMNLAFYHLLLSFFVPRLVIITVVVFASCFLGHDRSHAIKHRTQRLPNALPCHLCLASVLRPASVALWESCGMKTGMKQSLGTRLFGALVDFEQAHAVDFAELGHSDWFEQLEVETNWSMSVGFTLQAEMGTSFRGCGLPPWVSLIVLIISLHG